MTAFGGAGFAAVGFGVDALAAALAGFGALFAGVAVFLTGSGIGAASSVPAPIVRIASMPATPTRTITIAKMRTGMLIFSISFSLSAAVCAF